VRTVRRKPCRTCKVVKTLRMFYRTSARTRDGHMNVCKDCHNAYVRENRELKREQYRETNRRYDARPERRAQRAAYARTERGRAVRRAADLRYRRLKRLFEARA
jgi:ribosome-binding protein aMBF1 (putative translation factor)